MQIAKSFALARTTINQPLWLFPMHLRLLANMEVKHAGCLQLCFFTTSLLSFLDNGLPQPLPAHYPPIPHQEEISTILRALTATTKAVVCKTSSVAMQECQEAMGGVGYMDEPDEPEHNISRLRRDTEANMTWEGTTNVLASETIRFLMKEKSLRVWESWMAGAVDGVKDEACRDRLRSAWEVVKGRLNGDLGSVLAEAREVMFSLAWVVSGMLLCYDAQRDGSVVAKEIAQRWVLDGQGRGEFVLPECLQGPDRKRMSSREAERANWDCRIAWGVHLPKERVFGYRSGDPTAKL